MTRPCPIDPRFVHVLVPSKFGKGKGWKIVMREKGKRHAGK